MSDKQDKGKLGEDVVCAELVKRGHTIIARNFHKRCGEIDIISVFEKYIVFTEVKSRKQGSMVRGAEAVNFAKKRKIVLTADAYLTENPEILQNYPFVRYDIAEVWLTVGKEPKVSCINFFENAFDTEGVYTAN